MIAFLRTFLPKSWTVRRSSLSVSGIVLNHAHNTSYIYGKSGWQHQYSYPLRVAPYLVHLLDSQTTATFKQMLDVSFTNFDISGMNNSSNKVIQLKSTLYPEMTKNESATNPQKYNIRCCEENENIWLSGKFLGELHGKNQNNVSLPAEVVSEPDLGDLISCPYM